MEVNKEILEKLSTEIFQEHIDIATSPSMSSIVSFCNIGEENSELKTYCAFCGKPLKGHFEDKAFVMSCDCNGSKKEKELLLKKQELEKQLNTLKESISKLENEHLVMVRKSSIPFIEKEYEENNKIITESLEAYKKQH